MNQHFVPRVYLKHFAEKKENEYFIDVFDKKLEKYFNTNIKMICAEKNLYTLKQNSKIIGDKFVIEKMYSNYIEPLYLKSYNILTDDAITTISNTERAEIIIGIFQLYMRNPKHLNKAISMHKTRLTNEIMIAKSKKLKGITYLNEDFSFREWEDDDIIKSIIEKIANSFKNNHIVATRKICEFHSYVKIEISKITDDSEFITSDNPLSIEDFVLKNDNPFSYSKEFILPLNKKYILRLFHETSKDLNFIYRKTIFKGTTELFNDNINKDTARFLLGSKKSIIEHFDIQKILNDSSIDKKMQMIKDIIQKTNISHENSEMHNIMKFYFEMYEKQGTLSKLDENNFHAELSKINRDWKIKSIQ